MNRILIFSSAVICCLLWCSFYFATEKESSDQPPAEKIDVTLTEQNVPPVNPMLYGFSASNLYLEVPDTKDTAFTNALKLLKPQVIRWPGGDISNYAHGTGNGYGFSKVQIGGANIRAAKKMEKQGVFKEQKKMDHPYIQDFVQLVKLTGAKVLLVANVVTGTPDECVEQIRYFRRNNVEVIGVELGNELYQSNLRVMFRYAGGSYLSKVTPFVEALRKNFPGLKIAACAAPYNRTGDISVNTGEQSFFKTWNNAIGKNNIFDAIAIHYYTPLLVRSDVTADSAFQIAATELRQMYSEGGLIPYSIDYYRGAFPKSKLWITEWNIAPQLTNNFFLNTVFQAIYIQSFLHYMNEFNAANNNVFEIACFENLAGGGRINNYGVISATASKKENPNSSVVKRASYHSFMGVKELYDSRAVPMKVNCNAPSQSEIRAYSDTAAKTILLYWNNYSGKNIAIGNLVIGSDTISSEKLISVRHIHGRLSTGYGYQKSSRKNPVLPPASENKELMLSQLLMYGNSFGYCKIKME